MFQRNRCCAIALLLLYSATAKPAFELNFQQNSAGTPGVNGSWASSICNSGSYGPCSSFSQPSNEPTRFIYELVEISGVNYVHLVVGDPADDFAQEVYIEGTTGALTVTGAAHGASDANAPLGGPAQASGNPNRVIIRQILRDSDVSTEFFKDVLTAKPLITQSLTTADISTSFSIDMRSISYSDMTTTAPIINTQTMLDPMLEMANFDINSDSSDSVYTGGQYTYTDGAGLYGSEGTYTYTGGNDFDVNAVEWCSYWDGTQNPFTTTCQ